MAAAAEVLKCAGAAWCMGGGSRPLPIMLQIEGGTSTCQFCSVGNSATPSLKDLQN